MTAQYRVRNEGQGVRKNTQRRRTITSNDWNPRKSQRSWDLSLADVTQAWIEWKLSRVCEQRQECAGKEGRGHFGWGRCFRVFMGGGTYYPNLGCSERLEGLGLPCGCGTQATCWIPVNSSTLPLVLVIGLDCWLLARWHGQSTVTSGGGGNRPVVSSRVCSFSSIPSQHHPSGVRDLAYSRPGPGFRTAMSGGIPRRRRITPNQPPSFHGQGICKQCFAWGPTCLIISLADRSLVSYQIQLPVTPMALSAAGPHIPAWHLWDSVAVSEPIALKQNTASQGSEDLLREAALRHGSAELFLQVASFGHCLQGHCLDSAVNSGPCPCPHPRQLLISAHRWCPLLTRRGWGYKTTWKSIVAHDGGCKWKCPVPNLRR
jgi:hypothetical protein